MASSTQYASLKDKSLVFAESNYYGRIEEIWELDNCTFHICLLCWKWVDDNRRCIKKKDLAFTLVDLGRLREPHEPFILASQVKQVFYVTDPADNKLSIVVPSKRSILGIGDVDDLMMRKSMMHLTTSQLFTYLENRVEDDVNMPENYMCVDHTEGIHVVEYPRKRRKVNKS